MARNKTAPGNEKKHGNGGNLGFEAELFKAADKLRGNMEPSDYKHVVLGLIFLKYISDAFEAKHKALLAEDPLAAEDKDEYLADNVFWVPKEARWSHLQANAKLPTIGSLIDDAMRAIEKDNESLKGVLPKDYARPALNKVMLGELIDLISGIALGEEGSRSKDILGRVYEYFLGQFAGAEGKRGGEFYTPRSVVRVLVEMLEPYSGRVYDPCCGSGGMFVQSEKFVQEHGGRIGDIAIYGQESNYTTWRLAKMNLAVRGIDADIRWNNEGSFHKDELRDLKADYILANPPFNVSDWGGAEGIESNKFAFRQGEILFGKLRPYFHKVGVAPVDGVCSTDIVVVCPRTPHWFAFVLCVVSSDDFVEFTNAGSTGTKMPRTSWADMARYKIALPPDALAQAFNSIVRRQVDRLIAAVHESRTLAALRDALLPKLISGELQVKDVERFLEKASS